MENNYEAPALRTIGTVHELTQLELDKIGNSADALTEIAAALGLGEVTGVIQPD